MADTKDGRNKQAHDAEKRQREQELAEALERSDETEPPLDGEEDAAEDERDPVQGDGSAKEGAASE